MILQLIYPICLRRFINPEEREGILAMANCPILPDDADSMDKSIISPEKAPI